MARTTPRYRVAQLVRLKPRQRDAWRAAAEAEDVSLSEMIRTAVDTHVQRVLEQLTDDAVRTA